MSLYSPVKVDMYCRVSERGPCCNMEFAVAVKHAKEAFGEDAAVVMEHDNYMSHDICWLYGEPEVEPKDDPVCHGCGNTAKDGVDPDTGLCDYCMETPKQRAVRQVYEMQDAFDSGRPMSADDY